MFFNSHQNDFLKQFDSISNQYEIISLINYSSNTIVVKALHRFSKKIVAIKKYNNVFNTNYNAKKILREINILRQFSEIPHKNIIQLYDIYIPNEKDLNEIYLIMEFCESNLKNNLKFLDNQDYIIKILKDVLNGLYYCFKRGVIHRDIKPENILINFSNGNFTAKICDFNLARDLTLTYKTYQLIQYFIDSYKDNKFTEEGVNIELIIDKLNNHKLDENLKIYLQKKIRNIIK
jgi:serine/threonine protein kinase